MPNPTPGRGHHTFFLCLLTLFSILSIHPQVLTAKPHSAPVEAFFDTDCDDAVIAEINRARTEILIAIYSLTKRNIATALENAQERGAVVIIRYDADQAKHIESMQKLLTKLTKAGVRCEPIILEESRAHMHHKFMVVDRKVVVTGSYNFTHQGSTINRENLVVVKSTELATEFITTFKALKPR